MGLTRNRRPAPAGGHGLPRRVQHAVTALVVAAGCSDAGGGGDETGPGGAADAQAADGRQDHRSAPTEGQAADGQAPAGSTGDAVQDAGPLPAGPVPAPWRTSFIGVVDGGTALDLGEQDADPDAAATTDDGASASERDAGGDGDAGEATVDSAAATDLPPGPPDAPADAPEDTAAPGVAPALGLARHAAGQFLLATGHGSLELAFEDALLFVHQPAAGDVELTARVTPAQGCPRPGVLMAVTLRESTEPDSAYLLAALSGDGLAVIQSRAFSGALARTLRLDSRAPVPLWLRVGRRADTFSAAHSPDGLRWTTQSVALFWPPDAEAQVGMALAAPGGRCAVVVDRVTVRLAPAPVKDAAGVVEPADAGAGS